MAYRDERMTNSTKDLVLIHGMYNFVLEMGESRCAIVR